jgi:hypothetical protein
VAFWQDLWLIIKGISLIKTQNNKEKNVVKQEALSAEGLVHLQVSVVYGG